MLTTAGLTDMLEVRKVFYATTATTSKGNSYTAFDLCERPGVDGLGPLLAPGADTSRDGVGATLATGFASLPSACPTHPTPTTQPNSTAPNDHTQPHPTSPHHAPHRYAPSHHDPARSGPPQLDPSPPSPVSAILTSEKRCPTKPNLT